MNSFQRPTHSKDQVRITCKPFYLSPSNILKLKGQIVFYIFSSSFYFRILASTHTCNVILIVTACQNLKSENRTDKHVSNNFLYAAMNVLPIFSYLFLLHIYIYIYLYHLPIFYPENYQTKLQNIQSRYASYSNASF